MMTQHGLSYAGCPAGHAGHTPNARHHFGIHILAILAAAAAGAVVAWYYLSATVSLPLL
ncbi:MAG TPA: hypothetical protein VMT86_07555 [Bryobacteraceae bacterium]|nr:hypothetical protein [Bryobacteraceae bacterium]